ncbi:MAG: DUF1778 domain-containing protein [Glaciecola sp.]|jgi:uncharacterized protein (DUF1778 family)|nr:DUF1778 domain-containing protein [Glaciecola sp.]MDG1816973.1 DUF1778 domain-containing protein [Glaciecola sp.]MDG2099720.1 DUF1778 domain-containing protein [Glaciecola sp.]
MRLSIEITNEQHQFLKAASALKGQSIKNYVLQRVLPSTQEQEALQVLERLLEPRVLSAKDGDFSKMPFNDIVKEELETLKEK